MLRALGWIWLVITLLFELAVVVVVVHAAETRAETVMFSGGVLLYVMLCLHFRQLVVNVSLSDLNNALRFIMLAEILNHPKHAEFVEAQREGREKLGREELKNLVRLAVRSLEFAIALVVLLAAVTR
jgi:hypothetical protein